MACERSAPCGGLLRVTLSTSWVTIEECLNGHTFRHAIPQPQKIITIDPVAFCGNCERMGDRAPCAIHGGKKPAKPSGCKWCRFSRVGRCIVHGGPGRHGGRRVSKKTMARCGFCRMSRSGPCQRHGGIVDQRARDAITYRLRARDTKSSFS